MATITFNCPQCGSICAFKDICAGRRAKCLRCNQVFIIPENDNAKVQKVRQSEEFAEEPLPEFYGAVIKKSWPAIFNQRSSATLIFILIVTAFKFFVAHLDYSINFSCNSGGTIYILLPVGSILAGLAWGGIFWCYAEIIYATAFDLEALPKITFGGGIGYLLSALKSLFSFFVAAVLVLIPTIIFRYVFSAMGITSRWALLPFVVLALFMFPIAVLTISIGRDISMLFRPDYFFAPIKKAFKPYLFLAGLFILVWQLQYSSYNYGDIMGKSTFIILLNLLAVLAIQILAVFAMRATGLFYRHFSCYFKW